MFVRSQNRKRISNGIVSYYINRITEGGRTVEYFDISAGRTLTKVVDETVSYCIMMENEEVSVTDHPASIIGRYSTEEQALKVLDEMAKTLCTSGYGLFNMPDNETIKEDK